MSTTTIETIRSLLGSVLEGIDSSELRYRQRTAMQLLDLLEERTEFTRLALEHADPSPEVRARLEQLGYLE